MDSKYLNYGILEKLLNLLTLSKEEAISSNLATGSSYENGLTQSDKIISLYEFRLQNSPSNESKSKQVMHLLTELKNNDEPTIMYHYLQTKDAMYVIFTNQICERVFGILSSKLKDNNGHKLDIF